MRKVILDAATCAQLDVGGYPVAACNGQGRTVAVMVPADVFQEMMDVWVKEVFPAEDFATAREEFRGEGGYTTAEVKAYIGALARKQQGCE